VGYDAAERIAAHRGIVPEEFVHVQRGALVGARKLDLTVVKGRIRYADLASKLRVLSAGDVEDFLCLNKGRLNAAMLAEWRVSAAQLSTHGSVSPICDALPPLRCR
jgi:hypothetical protein